MATSVSGSQLSRRSMSYVSNKSHNIQQNAKMNTQTSTNLSYYGGNGNFGATQRSQSGTSSNRRSANLAAFQNSVSSRHAKLVETKTEFIKEKMQEKVMLLSPERASKILCTTAMCG